jgi:hypothetical protein
MRAVIAHSAFATFDKTRALSYSAHTAFQFQTGFGTARRSLVSTFVMSLLRTGE